MFCMGCGAELRPHAEACSVCGRRVGDTSGAIAAATARADRSRPLASPSGSPAVAEPASRLAAAVAPYTATYAAPAQAVAPTTPRAGAAPAAPSIGYGDTELLRIPSDAAGRLVLVVAPLLALDLQAPWVAFDGAHLSPARFTPPMLLAAALLLAAAASVLYTPLRQRPYYAAYPVALGAAAFGAAAVLTLMLGPFASSLSATFVAHVLAAPVVSQNLANPAPVTNPPIIGLAADTGLYVFLLGSAILTGAGYQLFVQSVSGASVPAAPLAPAPAAAAPGDPARSAPNGAAGRADHGTFPASPPPSVPGSAPSGVILPGSPGWDRPTDGPVGRAAPTSRGRPSR